MSLCSGSCGGLLFNQHCASLWPIRHQQLQYPPKRLCSPRSGWNPSPLCMFPVPLHFGIMFSTFLFAHRACSNLQFPGQPLQLYSNGLDSTSNAVECPVVQCCSCKLPFGSHHLRVHRFVSRTLLHSLFQCRRLMRGSGDVNIGSNN